MPNTWFKHDVNSAIKSELTLLIEVGGAAAYGRFWMLVEYAYMMQQTRQTIDDTIRVPQSRLAQVLNTRIDRTGCVLGMFRDVLNVDYRQAEYGSGTRKIAYWELKFPNLLKYIGKKSTDKKREEKKRIDESAFQNFEFTETHRKLAKEFKRNIQLEFDRFKDDCINKERKHKDLNRAFNNWLRPKEWENIKITDHGPTRSDVLKKLSEGKRINAKEADTLPEDIRYSLELVSTETGYFYQRAGE